MNEFNANGMIRQMQKDFDRMLNSDIPGQNHDCTIISDYGDG